ncbi:MAG: ferredoxin [Cyanobacteria bacterium J06597_1]
MTQVSSNPSPAPMDERTGLEPELGGVLRGRQQRSGYEPELGGLGRQTGVYVEETDCIGCGHCAYVARNTFFLEEDYGKARVMSQKGDPDPIVEEAIQTCPVDCIHRVPYKELRQLEKRRKLQVMPKPGVPPSFR